MPSETNSPWQEVISVALVGTERQPFQPPTVAGTLGQVLTQLSQHSPEAALLMTAATLSLHQQVGRLPEKRAIATSKPCPVEDLPVAPPVITRYLLRMLNGDQPLVLPEWLERVAQAGQRIPDSVLPDVLELGRQQSSLRPAIARVLGQRGQWVVQQNPDWNYAVQIVEPAEWETGSATARLLFLTNLRSQDPPQALTLLQASWKQEAAADRAKFLGTFRTGLSLADEAFLNEALADRSKEVRRVAADLLASLPESGLCQRMSDRLKHWVSVNAAGDLEIQLPDACDTAMQEDGIELKPQTGRGERAEWLRQMIGATPLTFWLRLQPQGIPTLLEMAQRSEWQELLYSGWFLATQRQRDREWATLFLHNSNALSRDQLQSLLAVLPGDKQQSAILQLLESQPDTQAEAYIWTALTVLAQQPHPWSDTLSHQILELIAVTSLIRHLSPGNTPEVWRMRDLFIHVPLRMAPHLITEASELRSLADLTPWESTIHTFLTILQFRHEMIAAFDAVLKGGLVQKTD